MKLTTMFVSLVLFILSSFPAWAGTAVDSCAVRSPAALEDDRPEMSVDATITRLDRTHGVLEVDTDAGRVQLLVPPAVAQQLHTGDALTICMVEEAPSQNLLQDSILTEVREQAGNRTSVV